MPSHPRLLLPALIAAAAALPAAAQSPWPQETRNPSLTIETIPLPGNYMTMGLAFLPDGRLALATTGERTTNGEIPAANPNSFIMLVGGLSGDLAAITTRKIADMLKQPAGLTVAEGKLYMAERDAFYLIPSLEPAATSTNKAKIIGWPQPEAGYKWVNGEQWHQYVMTPVYHDGRFYAPYGGTTQPGGRATAAATTSYSGAFLGWAPDGAGGLEKVAGGFRQPNGMALGAKGQMFVTDNQGGWLPACSFHLIKPGKTSGYKQAASYKANFAETLPYEPPVAWLVDGVHQSASQPMYMERGPYQGDFIIGDVNSPGLSRVNLDQVGEGAYNGGLFFFTGGFGTSAVNRLSLNPSDDYFVAGTTLAMGDWPSGNPKPMYRVKFSAANLPFEMRAIRSRQGGVEVVFSQPVDPATVATTSFSLQQWHYSRGEAYGCCLDQQGTPFAPASVKVSDDRLRVFVASPTVIAAQDRELKIAANGIKSAAGGALFHGTAYFTHNYQSAVPFNAGTVAVAPLNVPGAPDASLLRAERFPGGLRVHVAMRGPWRLTLLGPDGKVLSRRAGAGPEEIRFRAGAGDVPAAIKGLRILRLEGESGTLARPVLF